MRQPSAVLARLAAGGGEAQPEDGGVGDHPAPALVLPLVRGEAEAVKVVDGDGVEVGVAEARGTLLRAASSAFP